MRVRVVRSTDGKGFIYNSCGVSPGQEDDPKAQPGCQVREGEVTELPDFRPVKVVEGRYDRIVRQQCPRWGELVPDTTAVDVPMHDRFRHAPYTQPDVEGPGRMPEGKDYLSEKDREIARLKAELAARNGQAEPDAAVGEDAPALEAETPKATDAPKPKGTPKGKAKAKQKVEAPRAADQAVG